MARTSKMTDETFTEKHASARSMSELCQLTGSSQQWCHKRMTRLGLPIYDTRHWRHRQAETRAPTPEEIRIGCLEAQKKWTKANRELHTVQKCEPVECKEVTPAY